MDSKKIYQMLLGVMVGDALGSPHEFHSSLNKPYDGELHSWIHYNRFQGEKHLPEGQFSDDSEMMITLAKSLVKENGWKRDKVILAYLEWANSGIPFMGRNTRNLLKGIKTAKGYEKRFAENFVSPEDKEKAQSNGALMRSAPLACLKNINEAKNDVFLTNPSEITWLAEEIYLTAIRQGLQGIVPSDSWKLLLQKYPNHRVIIAVENSEFSNWSGKNKGWVMYPLYASLYCLKYFLDETKVEKKNYAQCMEWIIKDHPGSDTDTNAAIAGGLIGAYVGVSGINNVEKVLQREKSDIERPKEYWLTQDELEKLSERLAKLSSLEDSSLSRTISETSIASLMSHPEGVIGSSSSSLSTFSALSAFSNIDKDKLNQSLNRKGYTVEELKEFLHQLNLKVSGTKEELVKRLKERLKEKLG